MSGSIDNIERNAKAPAAVIAADSVQSHLESDNKKKIADDLRSEATTFSSDSKAKAEQARKIQDEATMLEQAARALRLKADQKKRNEKVNEDKAVEMAATILEITIPKDAPPEMLEELANRLESIAKDKRRQADDLLKQSEESERIAKQLQEHADMLSRNMSLSDIQLKTAQAHNEGLNLVFKKLGIYKLDAQYKQQVAYSLEKDASDKTRNVSV